LLTIARNAAIDALRYRHEQPVEPDLLLSLLTARDQSEPPDDPDTSLGLRQALAGLPREQATPILMMTFYGLTANEIATRDGVPVGTVKSRVRRGLRALRQRLGARDA
jgi:RNA polymerase sigma-70 factor (ECF subfamily)